jgi:hypothetical protein
MNNLFRIASIEEDKKSGLTRTVRFMQAGSGVVVNTSTTLKDSSGRYSISESSVLVPDVQIGETDKKQEDANQNVFLQLHARY